MHARMLGVEPTLQELRLQSAHGLNAGSPGQAAGSIAGGKCVAFGASGGRRLCMARTLQNQLGIKLGFAGGLANGAPIMLDGQRENAYEQI